MLRGYVFADPYLRYPCASAGRSHGEAPRKSTGSRHVAARPLPRSWITGLEMRVTPPPSLRVGSGRGPGVREGARLLRSWPPPVADSEIAPVSPKGIAQHLHRGDADVGGDVAVDVAGNADRGVAQDLRDDLERDAVGEHGAGGGVSEGVEADAGETGLGGGHLEGAERVAWVAGLTEGGGEDIPG